MLYDLAHSGEERLLVTMLYQREVVEVGDSVVRSSGRQCSGQHPSVQNGESVKFVKWFEEGEVDTGKAIRPTKRP